MEFAVYRIHRQNVRKLGTFVDMCASRGEAEELAERLDGEHQVVELWTREISEDDYSTVRFFDEAEEAGDSRHFGGLSLEEVEWELRALREYAGTQLTLNGAILAGVCISELEAARERKLRVRQVAEAAELRCGEGEE